MKTNTDDMDFTELVATELEKFKRQNDELESRLAESQRRVELLRAVAVAAEWAWDDGYGVYSCPICNVQKGEPHRSNCAYQAAIDGGALEGE